MKPCEQQHSLHLAAAKCAHACCYLAAGAMAAASAARTPAGRCHAACVSAVGLWPGMCTHAVECKASRLTLHKPGLRSPTCRAYITAILDHWGTAGEGLPDHMAFMHAHQWSEHTHLSHSWVIRALAAHRPQRVPLGYVDAQCSEQASGSSAVAAWAVCTARAAGRGCARRSFQG